MQTDLRLAGECQLPDNNFCIASSFFMSLPTAASVCVCIYVKKNLQVTSDQTAEMLSPISITFKLGSMTLIFAISAAVKKRASATCY